MLSRRKAASRRTPRQGGIAAPRATIVIVAAIGVRRIASAAPAKRRRWITQPRTALSVALTGPSSRGALQAGVQRADPRATFITPLAPLPRLGTRAGIGG